ncbi:MAG: SDR family oxidoreductase [Mesorhizobium sp.]|nr:SDR family oxidoreductase [Mesorhizobium sp.]MBL8575745.1 SDR family oxidoreductase [Mesorhizobium sp.]
MNLSLSGAALIVTGSTQGVGRAVALEAARNGAGSVLVTGRDAKRGAAVVAEIASLGSKAHFVAVDLATSEAADIIADAALKKFGRIDALVNAAGMTDRGSMMTATPELWDRLHAVNAKTPFFLMQRAIADMRSRKQPGAIVNILSINVHGGATDLTVYSASKAALALTTKNAAHAHRFDRIRINGINMGWADTPAERVMHADTLGKGPAWLAEQAAQQPFGRLLVAEDVARLTHFLLSPASEPMTGTLVDQEQAPVGPRDA